MPKKNDKKNDKAKDKKKVAAVKKKAAPPAKAKKVVAKKAAKPAAAKKPVVKKAAKVAAPKKAVAKPAAKAKAAAPVKKDAAIAAKKGAPVAKGKEAPKAAKPVAKAKPAREIEDEIEPVVDEVVEAGEGEEEGSEEVFLTDGDGRRYCRVKDCDQLSTVDGYCRFHYLLYWKKIQIRKKILSEGKLERYIEELTARYPDKFLDMLRKDLRSEKEFLAAIQELEIDENAVDSEFEDETQNYIDEVRGMGEATGSREEEDF
jgi:hypothetical protein